ncbi:isoaspartyl peptidase/L-asparaginase [Sphingomonas sp. I4]
MQDERRVFLGGIASLAGIGAGLATPARSFAQAASPRATILSTWDFGAPANDAAFAKGRTGGSLIDMVEAGVMVPEADPNNHSVGYGGYPDRDGHVTLDAVIMDDAGGVGAVAALEDTVHAISVARAVMEHTPHTFLVGEGATRFARDRGFPRVKLLTPEAEKAWREWLKTQNYKPVANSETGTYGEGRPGTPGGALDHDTIGMLARDASGRMAGACTTSGMAFKMRGRVGDSPQVGSGLYVERGVGVRRPPAWARSHPHRRHRARRRLDAAWPQPPGGMRGSGQAHRIPARRCDQGVQVGFLAMDTAGRIGAFCLLPGFTYAVTDSAGQTRVEKAPSLFQA